MLGPPTGVPMVIRRSLRTRPECRFIVNIHSETFWQKKEIKNNNCRRTNKRKLWVENNNGDQEVVKLQHRPLKGRKESRMIIRVNEGDSPSEGVKVMEGDE